MQWLLDFLCAVPANRSLPNIYLSPLGISSLVNNDAGSILQLWPSILLDSDLSSDSGPSSDHEVDSLLDSDDGRHELHPWDSWEAFFIQELDSSSRANWTQCSASNIALPCPPINHSGFMPVIGKRLAYSVVLITLALLDL